MDRREAIYRLRVMVVDADTKADIQALDLAIEALQENHQLSGETSTNEGIAESATTTDCISRQAAIEYIDNYAHMFTTGNYFEGMMNAVDLLKQLDLFPSVELKRPKGEWIDTDSQELLKAEECSVCGHESIERGNFCRYCGADMRGDKDER